jgi:hypothetical protein
MKTFSDVLHDLEANKSPHLPSSLLLGNGFSREFDNEHFNYKNLLQLMKDEFEKNSSLITLLQLIDHNESNESNLEYYLLMMNEGLNCIPFLQDSYLPDQNFFLERLSNDIPVLNKPY